jgi:hypothetical protein
LGARVEDRFPVDPFLAGLVAERLPGPFFAPELVDFDFDFGVTAARSWAPFFAAVRAAEREAVLKSPLRL